jgi:predicted Rossmann fold flavoprotein
VTAAIHNYDVLVLGAGAAGLMCAIEAGKRGRRVAVLDHAERAGKKILISGGGRCNFTNLHCRAENFLSQNPHFAKSALARYTPRDFLTLVDKHGIAWHEKKLGQLFCDHSAQQIVDLLLSECSDAAVTLHLRTQVNSVRHSTGFHLDAGTPQGPAEFRAPVLVIATGGLSIPKMGATGFGYDIARQFGLSIVEPRPALVPLVLGEAGQRDWCDLTGLSAEVIASTSTPGAQKTRFQARFQEKMLLTHRGLSGPAILQISSYWWPGASLTLDLAPGANITAPLLAQPKRDTARTRAALREHLPHRLADRLLALAPPDGFSNRALTAWEEHLHHYHFTPTGTEGYEKAEVTAGGVDTAGLSAKTMESRVPGLFFIGEAVDVTGHLGGFNFQWAWASGAAAGRAV